MVPFDLKIDGPTDTARLIADQTLRERFGPTSVRDERFELVFEAQPFSGIRPHATGQFLPGPDGLRLVGEVDLSSTTKALHYGTLVAFTGWIIVVTVQSGSWFGLVGIVVGCGALTWALDMRRRSALHRGEDRMRRIASEIQAVVNATL